MSHPNCVPKTPIPQGVSDLVGPNYELLFTATYNRNDFGSTPLTENAVPFQIGLLPNSYNLLNVPYTFEAFAQPPNSQTFITETYNFTSWNPATVTGINAQQYGVIVISNTYPNVSGTAYTSLPYIQYPVEAKNGIYKCVSTVVIDYTNDVRVVYFFKRNHH